MKETLPIAPGLRTLLGIGLITLALLIMGDDREANGVRDVLSSYSRCRSVIRSMQNVKAA